MTTRLIRLIKEVRRRRLTKSLHAWSSFCLAPLGVVPQKHHRLLIDALEKIESGEITRLMVMMPPGAAKSTYASVFFPSWFLAKQPNRTVILTSHTADLAEANSGRVIRVLNEFGTALGVSPQSEGVKYWRTNNNGEVKAAGVGGPITGRRADLLVIDDPVKSAEEAASPIYRDKSWDWFQADLTTRLKAGKRGQAPARIVLIMTRWHEDDLAGRLLQAQEKQWHVLKIQAQNTQKDDPLGREVGGYLWDDDEDYEYAALLKETKKNYECVGAMQIWQALYQQDPRHGEGALFKVASLAMLPDSLPGKSVRAWDLAATAKLGKNDPDWSVGVRITRSQAGLFIVDDVVRLRGGPDEVEAAIMATASRDGKNVQIRLPQDPGQAGKAQVMYLTRKLAGYNVIALPVSGDKATRAAPLAAQVNMGNVALVQAPWNRIFTDEISGFPSAPHDDQVDAAADAFAALAAEASRHVHVQKLGY